MIFVSGAMKKALRPLRSVFKDLSKRRNRSRLADIELPGFDAGFYLDRNPDVRAAGANPLEHFLQHGWREGRDPSAGFSVVGYLSANPDVAQADANPLLHFLRHGFIEGRSGWQKGVARRRRSQFSPARPASRVL